MNRLGIDIRQVGELTVLSLDGRATLARAPLLRKTLNAELDKAPRGVLVDASSLEEIAGACFYEILTAARQLQVRNGALAIYALNETLIDSLRQANLLQDIALYPDLDSARQAVEKLIRRARCAAAAARILSKTGATRSERGRPLRHRAGNRLANLVERVLLQSDDARDSGTPSAFPMGAGPMPSSKSPRSRLTRLLQRAGTGDEAARDECFRTIYNELKQLAIHQVRRRGPYSPMRPTTLVQELSTRFLEPGALESIGAKGRGYFFGAAARAMNDILVDEVRRQKAKKRGDGQRVRALTDVLHVPGAAKPTALVDLHDALGDLERLDPRQAQIVRLKFFVGLKTEEVAEALEISVAKVRREWAMAKAWLKQHLDT